jgi:hypothetical protein
MRLRTQTSEKMHRVPAEVNPMPFNQAGLPEVAEVIQLHDARQAKQEAAQIKEFMARTARTKRHHRGMLNHSRSRSHQERRLYDTLLIGGLAGAAAGVAAIVLSAGGTSRDRGPALTPGSAEARITHIDRANNIPAAASQSILAPEMQGFTLSPGLKPASYLASPGKK